MEVKFYTFAKKINSTIQPASNSALAVLDCQLKDNCGVLNPVLTISQTNAPNPSAWNYAYIADFGRYYFVGEKTYSRGSWNLYLSVDPLASWKSQIGASSQYIERCQTSSAWSNNLLDSAYPADTLITQIENSATETNSYITQWNSGYFVLGVLNKQSYANGLTYYVLTASQYTTFIYNMMHDDSWFVQGKTEDGWEIQKSKQEFNPMQYIVSAKWFPVAPNTGTHITYTMQLGWFQLPSGCQAYLLGSPYVEWTQTINVSRHPQTTQTNPRGAYLNCGPYAKYRLYYNPYGMIDLPDVLVKGAEKIVINNTVDCTTGKGSIKVFARYLAGGENVDFLIGEYQAEVGVDAPIGFLSQKNDFSQLGIGGAVAGSWYKAVDRGQDTITNLLTNHENSDIAGAQNWLNVKIKKIDTFISSTAGITEEFGQCLGSRGSIAAYRNTPKPKLIHDFTWVVDEDVTTYGRPSMKIRQINSLSGFIKTGAAKLELPATAQETSTILQTMNGGFYYE